ncbi:hypothetical protein Tco_1254663 [Tanacetum coccineum]
MVQTLTAKRSLTPVSSGPPSIKMPTSLSRTVTRANVKEKLHNVMRCLKTPSKFVKSLTFGASTLWAPFRPSRYFGNKFILVSRSTICQNGLKRKRLPPMCPSSLQLLKSLFAQIWCSSAIISDRGTIFERPVAKVMQNMELSPSLHRLSPTNNVGKWKYQIVAWKRILDWTIGENVPPGRTQT